MQTESDTSDDSNTTRADGGTAHTANYLNTRINIFKPQTPFMRDHLKLIWGTFIVWAVIVFGPVTVAAIAPQAAGTLRIAGTPALFMVTAIGSPLGALLLSVFYAWQRDKLDEKYGIDHEQSETTGEEAAAAADGGEREQSERESREVAKRTDGGEGR